MNKNSSTRTILYFLILGIISVLIFQFKLKRAYLVYNLVLSFVPYILTESVVKHKNRRTLNIFLIIIAILFYPNAIYMFTDFIHITTTDYYVFDSFRNVVYNTNYINWITLGCDVCSILLSMALSFNSFENFSIMLNLKKIWQKFLILIPLSLATGVAIYMGRIVRLNSWDVVTSIGKFINTVKTLHTEEILPLVLVFSATHFLIMTIFLGMTYRK